MRKLLTCTTLLMLMSGTTTMAGDGKASVIPWFSAPDTIKMGTEYLQPFVAQEADTSKDYQLWGNLHGSVCTKRVKFPESNQEYIVELIQHPEHKRVCEILTYPLVPGSPKAKQLKKMLQSK